MKIMEWLMRNWESLAALITGLSAAVAMAITAIKTAAIKRKLDGLDLDGDGKADLPRDFDTIKVGCPKCGQKFELKELILDEKQNLEKGKQEIIQANSHKNEKD